MPREKGDDRNLTQTPGVHERSPAWSPDGKWIAYFSDAGGEYGSRARGAGRQGRAAADRAAGRRLLRAAQVVARLEEARASPTTRSRSTSGRRERQADEASSSEPLYGPAVVLHHAWSPDSRWLAYTPNTPTYFNRLFLYSLAQDAARTRVSDGLADATSPVFDASGKYLYFLVSTDAGPVNDWFSQASADMREAQRVYLAVLAKGVPSPLAKESDEEKGEGREARAAAKADEKPDEKPGRDEGRREEGREEAGETGRGEVRSRRALDSGSWRCR